MWRGGDLDLDPRDYVFSTITQSKSLHKDCMIHVLTRSLDNFTKSECEH